MNTKTNININTNATNKPISALDVLLQRASVHHLSDPAPTKGQLKIMFRAALRAPDHGRLHPFRFLLIAANARQKLADLFIKATQASPKTAENPLAIAKAGQKPFRAATIITVIYTPKTHPKIPFAEQKITAGCAAHAILYAAHAQGIGAIWHTGELSRDALVKEGLGLKNEEEIIAFIYLGTPNGAAPEIPTLLPSDFVRDF